MSHNIVNVSTCLFFIVTFQHFTGHNTRKRHGKPQASQNDRESVVLLKLLNMISVLPSNIHLDMLSSSAKVRPFKFDVHYFDGGETINGWCFITLI